MPKQVQNPQVGQAIGRQFGLVGRIRPVIDEVIVPVVVVADTTAEQAQPAIQRAASVRFQTNAVAAQFGSWRLEVPPGTVARVDMIVRNGTADRLRWRVGVGELSAPSNTANARYKDSALTADRTPACVLTYGTQAAQVTWEQQIQFGGLGLADAWYDTGLIARAPVNGGYRFIEFQDATANQTGIFIFEWTEWPAGYSSP